MTHKTPTIDSSLVEVRLRAVLEAHPEVWPAESMLEPARGLFWMKLSA